MKITLLAITLLFALMTKTKHVDDDSVHHKVIFFAGDYCKDDCYKSRSIKKACMWFSTNDLDVRVSNLAKYSDSYREEYDCKNMKTGRDDWERVCKYRDRTFTWDREINRVYIGNSYTKIIVCDELNFAGTCISIWGKGCYDLDESGFRNKAKSMKLVRY